MCTDYQRHSRSYTCVLLPPEVQIPDRDGIECQPNPGQHGYATIVIVYVESFLPRPPLT